MRAPVSPYQDAIGTDVDDALDPPGAGFYAAVIPLSALFCLVFWVLVILKMAALVAG
jgi:hypothetical protein